MDYGHDPMPERDALYEWVLRSGCQEVYATGWERMLTEPMLPVPERPSIALSFPLDLPQLVYVFERRIIETALNIAGGSVTEAARLLSLGRTTLSNKLRDMNARQNRREARAKAKIARLAGQQQQDETNPQLQQIRLPPLDGIIGLSHQKQDS